jgi:hypothetical protein
MALICSQKMQPMDSHLTFLRSKGELSIIMLDLIVVAVTIVSFLALIAFSYGCDRL